MTMKSLSVAGDSSYIRSWSRMKRQPPIAAISVGALIDCTLQIVEVLLEQCSMPSSELVDRVAFALR